MGEVQGIKEKGNQYESINAQDFDRYDVVFRLLNWTRNFQREDYTFRVLKSNKNEKVAYAVCVNFPFEKYWINEDTYKYIQKVNCNKVGILC